MTEQVIPRHVVLIPDGNRRWARSKGWLAYIGHRKAGSLERIVELFYASKQLGIQYLSVWGFSTENWERDSKEVDEIFKVLFKALHGLKDLMHKEHIRFRHFGRKDRLPKDLLAAMSDLEEDTKDYTALNFNLLLDYGGRTSLIEAVNRILSKGYTQITERELKENLETNTIPDPDLIIRTSGEQRTSGVYAFEGTYAELYFTEVLFPDFTPAEFTKAIDEFSKRVRRFGGTNKKDLKNIKDQLIDPDKSS